MKKIRKFLATTLVFSLVTQSAFATTFTVNYFNAEDGIATIDGACDDSFGDDSGNCTFSEAIAEAQNGDTIQFGADISGAAARLVTRTDGQGYDISLNNLTIDGGGDVGFDGSLIFGDDIFNISGDNVTLQDLFIMAGGNNNADGIAITSDADSTTISGVTVGLQLDGSTSSGVYDGIQNSGTNTTITGTIVANSGDDGIEADGDGLTVSSSQIYSNTANGVKLTQNATNNTIKSSKIGTNAANALGKGNANGIYYDVNSAFDLDGAGGTGLVVGGSLEADGNYIVGHSTGYGVYLGNGTFNSSAVSGPATIQNNYFGIGTNGTSINGNGYAFVVEEGASGADITVADNTFGPNTLGIVDIKDANTATIKGNTFGLDANGDPLVVTGTAISVDGTTVNIGTEDASDGNTVSGLSGSGVVATGDDLVTLNIFGNTFEDLGFGGVCINIGANTAATINIGSDGAEDANSCTGAAGNGLTISDAAASAAINIINSIFSTSGGDGANINLADGDEDATLIIRDSTFNGNADDGVFLGDGLDSITLTGNTMDSNTGDGVENNNSATTWLAGGALEAARNVLTANGAHGFNLVLALNPVFKGNYIGIAADGTTAAANGGSGINVTSVTSLTVGGTTAGEGNVISGNTAQGVLIGGAGEFTATFLANVIGLNAAGTAAVANANGIKNTDANATLAIGDGSEAGRNVIAGNTTNDVNSTGGTLTALGNYFGVGSDGATVLSDNTNPISIDGLTAATIGGELAASKNIISNTNSIGVLATTFTFSAALDLLNTWTANGDGTTAHSADATPFYFWKDATTYGPLECNNNYDDDGDGVIDLDDPGCADEFGNDESSADPVVDTPAPTVSNGGGGSVSSVLNSYRQAAAKKEAEKKAEEEAKAEPVVVEEPKEEVVVEEPVKEEPVVVEQKPVYVPPAPRPTVYKDQGKKAPVLSAAEQRTVQINKLETKLADSKRETAKDDSNKLKDLYDDLYAGTLSPEKKAQLETDLSTKAKALALKSGGVFSYRSVTGSQAKITERTKIRFETNYRRALKEQQSADRLGKDYAYLTTFSDLDENGVADFLELGLGLKSDEKVSLSDQIFYGAVDLLGEGRTVERLGLNPATGASLTASVFKAFAKNSTDLAKYLPEKVDITNIPGYGATVGKEMPLWVVGPDIGEKFTLKAVDFKTLKETKLGEGVIGDNYKSIVPVTFPAAGDYYIVVSASSGESVVRVNVDLNTFEDEESLEDGVLSGTVEPGSVVFVTWESVVMNSVVIADAGQGYYEIPVPKGLENGDHKVTAYAYDPKELRFGGPLSQLFKR